MPIDNTNLAVIAVSRLSSLSTLISYPPFIHRFAESTLGVMMAFLAGALVYVGGHASDPGDGTRGTPQYTVGDVRRDRGGIGDCNHQRTLITCLFH